MEARSGKEDESRGRPVPPSAKVVEAWQRRATQIRAYVVSLRSGALSRSRDDAALPTWCEWAGSYAHQLDPAMSLHR